jgi:hypothetical protein
MDERMKLLLSLGTAFVLALSACGAAAGPAPHPTNASARVPAPTVRAVAAERKAAAGRKAEGLLRLFVLPPDARRAQQPAGVDMLSRSNLGVSVVTEFAQRHRFWRVPERLASAVAFVKRHPLRGFALGPRGRSVGADRPVFWSQEYDGPRVDGRPMQRLLAVTLVELHGWTVIRVDAGAAWIYPRSPHEAVPRGVREIDLRDGHVRRRVVDPARVARIVRWFDALNVVQPHTAVICAAILASKVTLVFRSPSGAELGSSVVPSQPADGCDPISFTIHGHRQTPLVDGTPGAGRSFVDRVQRLLGVRFPKR